MCLSFQRKLKNVDEDPDKLEPFTFLVGMLSNVVVKKPVRQFLTLTNRVLCSSPFLPPGTDWDNRKHTCTQRLHPAPLFTTAKNRSETMQLECSTSTQWLLSEHKRNEIHIIIQMNCEWHYTKVKRPDTKDHILFDCYHEMFTREKCKRQKVNGCLLVAGNRQRVQGFFLGVMKIFCS